MSWLDSLAELGKSGVDAYATVRGSKPANIPSPAPAASQTPSWLMPAIIGGVLLVVVLVFVGKK